MNKFPVVIEKEWEFMMQKNETDANFGVLL